MLNFLNQMLLIKTTDKSLIDKVKESLTTNRIECKMKSAVRNEADETSGENKKYTQYKLYVHVKDFENAKALLKSISDTNN